MRLGAPRTGVRQVPANPRIRISSSRSPRSAQQNGRSHGPRRSAPGARCGVSAWSSRSATIRSTASGAGLPRKTGSGSAAVSGARPPPPGEGSRPSPRDSAQAATAAAASAAGPADLSAGGGGSRRRLRRRSPTAQAVLRRREHRRHHPGQPGGARPARPVPGQDRLRLAADRRARAQPPGNLWQPVDEPGATTTGLTGSSTTGRTAAAPSCSYPTIRWPSWPSGQPAQ